MPGAVMPMLFFPDLTFQRIPFVLTLKGQYIVKNLVLVSAGLVIGATVRGGGLRPSPTQERFGTSGTSQPDRAVSN